MEFIFDVFVAQQVRTTAERIKANEQRRTFRFFFKYLAEFLSDKKVLILLLFNFGFAENCLLESEESWGPAVNQKRVFRGSRIFS